MDPTCTTPSARVPATSSRLLRALLGAAVGLLLACLLGASPARAANSLGSSTPADGATLTTSPASIEMKFTQPLGQQNVVAVVCNGTTATTGAPQVGTDQLTLTVPLTTPL